MGRMWPDPTPAGGRLPKPNHGRKPSAPRGNVHGRKPSPPKPPAGKSECCPMVAAVTAARRGKYRLARRYAAWSIRLIAARIA